MRDIGKSIRRYRTERGMTQEELAEQLFVTRQTVSNYEMGRSRPDIETLLAICRLLDKDMEDFLYGEPPCRGRRKIPARFLAGGAALALGAAAGVPLGRWLQAASAGQYLVWPGLVRDLLLAPAWMFCLGWWLMEGIKLLGFRPSRNPWAYGLGKILLAAAAADLLICAPVAAWCLLSLLPGGEAAAGAISSLWAVPGYGQLAGFFGAVHSRYALLWILPGMAGCLGWGAREEKAAQKPSAGAAGEKAAPQGTE